MGIVTFGPLVTGVRGSVGGVTFSRGASGATVRARPVPPKPRSEGQREQQGLMATAATAWRSLSEADRSLYAAWAATVELTDSLGRTYRPTAFQAFVWCYCVEVYCTGSFGGDPPASTGLPAAQMPTFSWSGNDLVIENFSPGIDTGDHVGITIYGADQRVAFKRKPIVARIYHAGPDPVSWTVAAGLKNSVGSPGLYRAFIDVRCFDQFKRPSILGESFIDWEEV